MRGVCTAGWASKTFSVTSFSPGIAGRSLFSAANSRSIDDRTEGTTATYSLER